MEKIIDLRKRLRKLMAPTKHHYSLEERIDPFQPFLRTTLEVPVAAQKKKGTHAPKKCSNPLECIDIGQLTLIAIITENGKGRIAMAQDAAGIGYFLYPGLRIGYRKGIVKDILSDRVIIKEKVKDIYGNLTTRDRVMLLHPKEK